MPPARKRARRSAPTKKRFTSWGREQVLQGQVVTSYSRWVNLTGTVAAGVITWPSTAAGNVLTGAVIAATGNIHYRPLTVYVTDAAGDRVQTWNWTPTPTANFFKLRISRDMNANNVSLTGVTNLTDATATIQLYFSV